jgi:hypothetical protein
VDLVNNIPGIEIPLSTEWLKNSLFYPLRFPSIDIESLGGGSIFRDRLPGSEPTDGSEAEAESTV